MSSIRIALIGDGAETAEDIRALLSGAGYTCDRDLERADVVLLLLGDTGPGSVFAGEFTRIASTRSAILVASGIDLDVARFAAEIGVRELTTRDDLGRLLTVIERVCGEPQDMLAGGGAQHLNPELLRKIVDLTPNYVSVRDEFGKYILVSQSVADFYGTTVEEMLGKSLAAFSATKAEADIELDGDREVLLTRRSWVVERDFHDRTSATRRLQMVKRPIVFDSGKLHVLTISMDITRRARTESALGKANEFLNNILETITDAVFALDSRGRFTMANQRLSEMTGYPHRELIGAAFSTLFVGESLAEAERCLKRAVVDGVREERFEARIVRHDGNEAAISCSLAPLLEDASITGIVGTAEDITQRKVAERRIEHLAYHDSLTNLPNRRLFGDRLQVAISQSARSAGIVAVLTLDVDRFKGINDSLGHRTGDFLLQEIGDRLRGCVRAGDTVARIGADEFIFLLAALESADQAQTMARKILDAIKIPFQVENREFVITACVGISLYPLHAQDGDMLVRYADAALFNAKRRAPDSVQVFAPTMQGLRDQFLLENELRRAIGNGELKLHYQPIVEMQSGKISSLEALVRWEHPSRGLLLPDRFIALAEQSGLIGAVGDWVLDHACTQNRAWQAAGLPSIPVAINLSAKQFDGTILARIKSALAASQLAPEFLEIEVTESTLVESAANPIRIIDELKSIGLRVSIDDFGTGYSSLSYLERFPIDTLKIDRSFIPKHPSDPDAGIIAGAIISMAHSLRLRVIAEGVESQDQRDFLAESGCDYAQGYYYSRPLSPELMEPLLAGAHRLDCVAL
ncbi:MAG: EAL domain-containing protein [Candidatus Eremiobacteraeota bacterium]|nr:EAL domain-containing protein [Candidatus Eremiobacteraeota bacterium]